MAARSIVSGSALGAYATDDLERRRAVRDAEGALKVIGAILLAFDRGLLDLDETACSIAQAGCQLGAAAVSGRLAS